MLSWASYLFGSSTTEPEKETKDNEQGEQVTMETEASSDKDWVVVEHKDCCFGNRPASHRSHVTCYPGNCNHGDSTDSASSMSDSTSNNSPCKSESSSPSKHSTPSSLSPVSHSRHLFVRTRHGHSNEAWILTPPSCFTAGNGAAPEVGITDLENLLIEHPSMSVYKRSGSAGEESNTSEMSSSELVVKSKRSQAVNRQSPRRMRAVSARAVLIAQVSQVKQAQKVQHKLATKRNNKKNLGRCNKVASFEKRVSSKNRGTNSIRPDERTCPPKKAVIKQRPRIFQ